MIKNPVSAKSRISLIPMLRPFWLLVIFILCDISSVQAQSDVDIQQSDPQMLAPVTVDGYVLFKVRGILSYPATARAKTIEKRIRKVAQNKSFSIDSVIAKPEPERIQILAGRSLIMNLYDVDAEVDAVTKEILKEMVLVRVKESITRYRAERKPEYIKANIRKALGALAIGIVSLLVFSWIFSKLNDLFKRRIKSKIDTLENVSFKLIQSNKLVKILHVFYQVIKTVILLFIAIFCIDYILGLFPGTRQFALYILELLIDPMEAVGIGFIKLLPSLIVLVIIFMVTRYLLKLIGLFFTGIGEGGITIKNFDPEWAMPTFKIVKLLVIVFALVISFPYIPGSSSNAFQGISVFLGILFSLGSSSFIANIIAGYSMTYRRAFKIGDRIQVNEFTGFVLEQSLMVTRLRSVKNEEVVIPNSLMLSSTIKNFSQAAKERGIILHTTVGIGYETPWRLVEAMLIEAAGRTTGLLKDPTPWVFQKSLDDFAVTYEINALCNDPDRMYFIYTDLHRNILDVFNENNVQIMTPAYEGDPTQPKVVPSEQWNTTLNKQTAMSSEGQTNPPAE